jgi:multidrug efflux pump subunit AcrA (membrane-fusion protein)
LELLQFELQLKTSAVEAAQLQLDLHGVHAPFNGTVALLRGRLGEWVEPGAPVMRLIAIDRLRAEGFAPASQIQSEDVGRPVQFAVAVDDGSAVLAEGTLRFVSPEMDPVAKQVRIWAEIDNSTHRLRPGAQGRLTVYSNELTETLNAADAR